jgi:type VI secretion system protein ImpK
MTDDPLAGTDRTVIMPMPGGRVATGRGATADEGDDPAAAIHTTGLNPLVAAANPLLDVVPPLRAPPSTRIRLRCARASRAVFVTSRLVRRPPAPRRRRPWRRATRSAR